MGSAVFFSQRHLTLDVWGVGSAYEAYIGRWSRPVAQKYLHWLGLTAGLDWLDVGCGTGALSRTILQRADPRRVLALDRSAGFVRAAAAALKDGRCSFACADAQALPISDNSVDVAVSGLVLNFIPDPQRALRELRRVVRPGGVISAYVWDYAAGMQMLRVFWDEAVALDPAAEKLDEASRFPLCQPDALRALFDVSGLRIIDVSALEVPTLFNDFDDYWTPFLGGQGPAPTYLAGLSEEKRTDLRERLRTRLDRAHAGGINLSARAWAIRGVNQ